MEDNKIERAIEANQEYENSLDRQLEKDIDSNFEGLAELIKDDDLFIWYKALIKEQCLDYALKNSIEELREHIYSNTPASTTREDIVSRIKELESKVL